MRNGARAPLFSLSFSLSLSLSLSVFLFLLFLFFPFNSRKSPDEERQTIQLETAIKHSPVDLSSLRNMTLTNTIHIFFPFSFCDIHVYIFHKDLFEYFNFHEENTHDS